MAKFVRGERQELSQVGIDDRAVTLREFYATHFGKGENPEARRVHLILNALRDLGPVRRALDVGCGDGTLAAVFARHCDQVTGIELSMEACTIAHSRGIEVAQADVENYAFPFRSESFDVVVAGEIIEHMTDPDHFLREITRVLKPGGHCILTTPNLASWYNRLLLLLGYQPYHTDVSFFHQVGKLRPIVDGGSGHFRVFTLRALRELLAIHHLRPIAIQGCTVPMTLRFPLNMVERTLSSFPAISSYLVVLTRKEDGDADSRRKMG
jgi:methionine biosynthesis protein MetW